MSVCCVKKLCAVSMGLCASSYCVSMQHEAESKYNVIQKQDSIFRSLLGADLVSCLLAKAFTANEVCHCWLGPLGRIATYGRQPSRRLGHGLVA